MKLYYGNTFFPLCFPFSYSCFNYRRFTKRIYVPLPDPVARKALIQHMLAKQGIAAVAIGEKDLDSIVKMTEGYSGSDLTAVCQEAALCPIRELGAAALRTVKAEDVRYMNIKVGILIIILLSVFDCICVGFSTSCTCNPTKCIW